MKSVQQESRAGFLDGYPSVRVDAAGRPEQPEVHVDGSLILGAERAGQERQGVRLAGTAATKQHLVVAAGKPCVERPDVYKGLDEGASILALGSAEKAGKRSVNCRGTHRTERSNDRNQAGKKAILAPRAVAR
jgi:hypothetical protein